MSNLPPPDDPPAVPVKPVKTLIIPSKNVQPAVTALAVPKSTTAMDIVRPMVDAEIAVANWNTFQQIKARLLEDNTGKDNGKTGDIALISGQKSIKKSGWRKIATVFNLSDDIIFEIRETSKDFFVWRIKVKVTAPNGRYGTGVGACASNERKFAHLEHDVYSTAHTRAKSRAISDLVGGGEVSAEELE